MILTYAADFVMKKPSEEEKNFLRACNRWFTDLTFHYGAQIVTVWWARSGRFFDFPVNNGLPSVSSIEIPAVYVIGREPTIESRDLSLQSHSDE